MDSRRRCVWFGLALLSKTGPGGVARAGGDERRDGVDVGGGGRDGGRAAVAKCPGLPCTRPRRGGVRRPRGATDDATRVVVAPSPPPSHRTSPYSARGTSISGGRIPPLPPPPLPPERFYGRLLSLVPNAKTTGGPPYPRPRGHAVSHTPPARTSAHTPDGAPRLPTRAPPPSCRSRQATRPRAAQTVVGRRRPPSPPRTRPPARPLGRRPSLPPPTSTPPPSCGRCLRRERRARPQSPPPPAAVPHQPASAGPARGWCLAVQRGGLPPPPHLTPL